MSVHFQQELPVIRNVDVVVVGAGPAGLAAAVAAARNGANTMLIEQTGVLGGMATSGLVGPFMTCYDNDVTEQVVKGIFDIIKEINRQGVTVLLIEQNANMALRIADVAYVLETGKITLSGSGRELLNNEQVKKAYLG